MLSTIGKIVGLITLGKGFTQTLMFRKFLSGVAAVVALTIITGMMVGSLMLVSIYGIYLALMNYGLEPTAAMFATVGIAVFITGLLIFFTLAHLRRLADVPKQLMQTESPVAQRMSTLADSFVDGLLTREVPEIHTKA